MAFLGLMTVREHEAVVARLEAGMDDQRTRFRKEAHDDREMIARLGGQKVKHLTGIARLQREVEGLRADVRQAEAAHDKAAAELATLKDERDGLLNEALNLSSRAKLAETRVNTYLDEIEALKPDALKYRERLRRDREALAAKRKRNAPAVRLTPAAPPPA